ncbi:nucleoside hydrolase-like domain-containing protein [Bremerella sp.]|uniref:nucleoside hydrolase-like domain-containing protein n=1 Tax=Bremerella sp. TaxID=2795602 RepID=UPI00391AA27B
MKCFATTLLAALAIGLTVPYPANAAEPEERLRVIIETDAPGGDPDDEGSLVRFFLYLNEWDVEGILCTRRADQSRTGETGKECLDRFIDAYQKVWPSLTKHDRRYPSPKDVRAITFPSYSGTQARDAIIAAVDREDSRRIWYVNWGTNDGNLTAMRQALDDVKKTRSDEAYRAFADRLCFSRDADRGYHVREHIPYLHKWVDTRNPNRWYHRFQPLTHDAGGFDVQRDIKTSHGPLGALYTIQKEGDTPGFLYLVPNGLSDVWSPEGGSWAGRFVPRTDEHRREGFYWSDARDKFNGSESRDNTLRRWAKHIQNDFQARLDWCVQSYQHANHPPVVIVNDIPGTHSITIQAAPGENVALSGGKSSDPDEDALAFRWFVYSEAGSFGKEVPISKNRSQDASLTVPRSASGQSIHVILQVTDDGEPALTRYRRVVIQCQPSLDD